MRLGATIEHTYTSPAVLGPLTWEEVFHEIRAIGPKHIVLSTDLGQAKNMFPDAGLLDYAQRILDAGFTADELHQMMVVSPETLLGI